MSNDIPHPTRLTVHGIDACEDTVRARRHLDAAGVPYVYIDLDQNTEARQHLHEAGFLATPVVSRRLTAGAEAEFGPYGAAG